MRKIKKLFLIAICTILLLCICSAMQVSAVTYITDKTAAIGSNYTRNLSLASALDSVFYGDIDIYSDSSFKNEVSLPIGKSMNTGSYYYVKSHTTGNSCVGKQCYVYANAVYNKLFKEWVGHGTSLSHSEVVIAGGRNSVSYSLFSSAKIKCGAYMRTTDSSSGTYNGSAGHSLIILSYNTEYITYLEGNADGKGLVRITKQTWSEFNTGELSGRSRYISHIVQPVEAKYNELYPSSYENLGNDFYARIKHPTSGNYLCNVNSNVELGTGGTKASKWRFIRQADGSYKIYSCVNNGLIDVSNASTANGTNIQVCSGDSGSDAQKWHIVKNGQYYNFVTPLCGKALDLANGKTTVGTNVQLCNLNGNSAQLFAVVKICSSHTYTSKVTKAATCTASGERKYECSACSESYTEEIKSTGHSYDSGKVTKAATCKATGVKTYTCSVCKDTKTETIAKLTTHTYKTTTTKATLSKNGSIVKKCTVCSKVASTTTISYPKTFKLSDTSYAYDGNAKTPTVTVKDATGKTLKKGTDYTVTYASGRKAIGTYKVTIKMTGNYSGTKTLTFKINVASVSTCTFKLAATSYTYDGKTKAPAVTVKNAAGKTLKKNTDYTVTYASGRKNVGTYKVTIKLKGNYTGTKTLTFKIIPKAASISKLTAKSKAIAVKLNRVTSQSTGYEIQYSTAKDFKGAKTTAVKSYKTSSVTLSKLKAKTTYYVRVRTYKTVNGTKIYSNWSTAKSIKTK